MKVRLDRLGDEPVTQQETLALSPDDLGHPDVSELGEVACRFTLAPIGPSEREGARHRPATRSFHLRVELAYAQTLSCTRCLRPLEENVDSSFELVVVVGEAEAQSEDAEEQELAEEDLGLVVLAEPELDLRPLVIEQMHLSVPMKSLCRDDCAGLCPHCGADRNDGPCGCGAAADPRWAALAALKDRADADRADEDRGDA